MAGRQCDIACNVTVCGYDKGDCVAGWRHSAEERRARNRQPQDAPGDGAAVGGGGAARGAASRAPLGTPHAAVLEAHVPGVLSLSASADASTVGMSAVAGALGAIGTCLCCGGALCGALCWALVSRRRRYGNYSVVNGNGLAPTQPYD